MDEENTVQNELLKKITTLKKNDGTTIIYPRTVTDAIKDKDGRKLTEIIESLKKKTEEQSNSIEEIENTIENTISSRLSTKVDKEEGKGLSTNDFTNELKSLLETTAEDVGAIEQVIQDEVISKVNIDEEKISFQSKGENVISELHFLDNADISSIINLLDDENN